MISLSPGLVIARKIRLDREIARGGMGSVWAALNTQLEAPVAVKFMSPAAVGSPELVARFQREAKAAAQIRSPHVVQIFEHGMHLGLPYIVMELLEGEDLGSRIRRRERLTVAETVEIVAQVCKALRRAHEMGIVHRDLKPANVFLARHDDDEIVKVLDFGIAKSLAPSADADDATQTGTLVGTPHYMSPEQAQRSKQIDARSDLWSLGVIAFRALTGRVPFKGDDMINVLVKVCTEPAPAPSSFAPDLGPEVDALFARALCRDIEGRFQSAREMSEAFWALLGRRSLASEMSLGSVALPPPSSRRVSSAPPSAPGSLRPLALSAPPVSVSTPPVSVSTPPVSVPVPLDGAPIDPPTVADDPATHGDAADRTALDASLSARPGPLLPSPPQAIPSAASADPPPDGAPSLSPSSRPSRARTAVVVGGAVRLAGGLAAFLSRSEHAAASSDAEASSLTGAPGLVVSATATATATPTATATATATVNPSATVSSTRPASTLRGSVPRSTSAPRSTGAIGGRPKF